MDTFFEPDTDTSTFWAELKHTFIGEDWFGRYDEKEVSDDSEIIKWEGVKTSIRLKYSKECDVFPPCETNDTDEKTEELITMTIELNLSEPSV